MDNLQFMICFLHKSHDFSHAKVCEYHGICCFDNFEDCVWNIGPEYMNV